MRALLILVFYYFELCSGSLWPKGVVHFAVNQKDYDLHSQDVILTTFSRLQEEICVKFFNTPTNYTASEKDKILFISNPDKKKDCPPTQYDFSGSVVDITIGYRCVNSKDISRIIVDMLKSSIQQTVPIINSYDLVKKFRERDAGVPTSGLLSSDDRNFINAHYHSECGTLAQPVMSRRAGDDTVDTLQLTADNLNYYGKKLWPLGIVMYSTHPEISYDDPDLKILHHAMATIELASCVVFQRAVSLDVLAPKNFLWISKEGADMPELGFQEGNQTLKLSSLSHGAPGHTGHTLSVLMRALGVPMMSNRHDRDNYVTVNWRNVERGKEHFLEKGPESSWLPEIPYDFNSVTHAPANYMCRDCDSPIASQTVLPIQDHLWQKTLSMGHHVQLSESDKQHLRILYGKQCEDRFLVRD